MKKSWILAIDQGTTGTTALAIDARGAIRGRGYAELPQHFPKPGWVEHDADQIWRSVLAATSRAIRAAQLGARHLAGIGLTNQRETAVLWDRESGEPLGRAIVWQDRRTAELCAALKRRGYEREVRRRTGLLLDPYFSGTKLTWRLRGEPRLRALAKRGRVAFGTVDSWLLWKLTGGAVHATDPTNASRTLLYNIATHAWDPWLLERFEVPASMLPSVMPSSGEFGRTRAIGAIPAGVPIAGIAGDQQAALFGQGCVAAGQSKNTYGTGCFLLLHTGSRRVPSKAGLLTTVACGPRGELAYALEGSVFVAGAAVQWLRDGLGIIAKASDTERLARSVPDAGGVVVVPAFVGLGAPWWRPEVRGAILGLTRGTTRAHLARATLESLAFQSGDLVAAMARDSGRPVRVLRVDGGAAANDWLMQYQADLLGVPVERPRVIETTAYGAGLLAGLGVGLWRSHRELARAIRIERTFRPRKTRRWRTDEWARWRAAIERLTSGER
ncbi:MAG: glycerol kinase GlpK [Candidatus Eisenbacteria bacterium]|uniref:Glycerol kinase n=1 Tax=Eiseniibacteriota bacterium TaxID=2212470 RepID=A0A849SWH1_UNCEI|nr:glycerol kinase GlpK [Candidatus Eisenbacteria bacterium]